MKKMKDKYKTIGPHVVKMPPGLEIQYPVGVKPDPIMTPIHERLNAMELEGWELHTIVEGFPITLPQSSVIAAGKPQVIQLTGVCAILKRKLLSIA